MGFDYEAAWRQGEVGVSLIRCETGLKAGVLTKKQDAETKTFKKIVRICNFLFYKNGLCIIIFGSKGDALRRILCEVRSVLL